MNNEEKEAIEEVKRIIECIEEIYHYDCDTEDEEYLKVVLNCIDKYEKRITFLREKIYELNKKVKKLQKENEELKRKTHKALDYIEENSFEDTTGIVLNLQDESYWELWKLLKGDE